MKFGVREIVFAALLMGILVAAWWLDFRPNNVALDKMDAEIEAKRKKLQAVNNATGVLGDLRKEIDALEDGIAYFRTKLPNEKEIDKVLEDISDLAKQNHLTAKIIQQVRKGNNDDDKPGQYLEQPVAVKLQGDFRGFYSFLLALENKSRIMRVRSLKLTKIDGPDNEGQVEVDFLMSVYFMGTKEK